MQSNFAKQAVHNPVQQIIQFIRELKPKYSHVQQNMLTYFTEILNHPDIGLANHFKILFEIVCEVEGTSIHTHLLTQFNRMIDKGAVSSRDYSVVSDYFRNMIHHNKVIIQFKMVQIILSMIHQISRPSSYQLSEVLKLLTISEAINKCVQKLTIKIIGFLQTESVAFRLEIQTLIVQICLSLAQTDSHAGEIELNQDISLLTLERIYNSNSYIDLHQTMLVTNKKAFQTVTQKYSRSQRLWFKEKCLLLLSDMVVCVPNQSSCLVQSLTSHARELAGVELTLTILTQLFSRNKFSQPLLKCIPDVLSFLSTHVLFADQTQNSNDLVSGVFSLLGIILEYPSKHSDLLDQQTLMDQIKNILIHIKPIMQRVQRMEKNQKKSLEWDILYNRALRYCFMYRTETTSFLQMVRHSRQLFQTVVDRYSSYFEQDEYAVLYHTMYIKNWMDYSYNKPIKQDVLIRSLKTVILESLNAPKPDQTLLAIKDISKIVIEGKGDSSMVKDVMECCILIVGKGLEVCERAFVDLMAKFLTDSHFDWFRLFVKVYDLTQTVSLRLEMLEIINKLIGDSGDSYSEDIWLSIITILNESFSTDNTDILSKALSMLETIVQQYIHSFGGSLVHKIVECVTSYPFLSSSDAKAKDKYRICGLLWTLGEKHFQGQSDLILGRLGEMCLDSIPEVSINGLCIYSQLGTYQGFEKLAQPILKHSKENVVMSYLQNYVKVVRRTFTPPLYEKINGFIAHYLPELYELNSNQVIIQSTSCHKQLTILSVNEIFQEPEYYELGLFFFINYLSQKPKQLKLVRYSIPKMIIQLMSEMVFLSNHAQFNQSILAKSCLALIDKAVGFSRLTDQVFNLDKNKIYFEEIQLAELLKKIYFNFDQKRLFTPLLKILPVSRQVMIRHASYLPETERLDWLAHIGEPTDSVQMKTYCEVYDHQSELEYINQQEGWGLREYLILKGRIQGRVDRSSVTNTQQLDFTLCEMDQQDSEEVCARKKVIVQQLMARSIKIIKEGNEEQVLSLLTGLADLLIHPQVLGNDKVQIKSRRGHLFYLGHLLISLSLKTSSQKIKNQLQKIAESMSVQLQIITLY